MKRMMILSLLTLAAHGAMAQYRVLGETDTSASAGSESFAYSYTSHGDLLANTWSSWQPTQLDWTNIYHTAELAYDGKYRLFGETSTSTSGSESVIFTYDTYDDFIAGHYSTSAFTSIDWDSSFRTVGFEYDGLYRLMGETTTTASGGSESVLYTYNSFDDLLANNWASLSVTQIDWNPDFHTAGIAYDGKYRLFGETSTTAGAGVESYVYTYDSYSDLLSNNWSGWSATQLDWNSDYHTAGYTYQAVPEPATMATLGLGALAVLRRRKRK